MHLDFTPDFYLLDNLEPLTLQITGLSDVTIPAAVSMPAEYAELDHGGGNLLKGDRLFAWPRNVSQRPPLGAKIMDSNGDAWTILAVDAQGDVKSWDCRARALSIVYRLDNLATVLKASYTKSACGEAQPTWTPILTGIGARFQPVETEAQILENAEWPKTTYHVYLGVDIFAAEIPVEPASADFRLVDSTGRHYRIMQYQRAQRIDALPIAVCVSIIEGTEGAAIDRMEDK